MTTESNKDVKGVVLTFLVVSLLILGSIVVSLNVLDVIYLCVIAFTMIRYIYIKKGE